MLRNEDSSGRSTLGEAVQRFFGSPPPRSREECKAQSKANFELWKTDIMVNETNGQKFKSSLSQSQLSSQQVLEEWMLNVRQDRILAEATIKAMKSVPTNRSSTQHRPSYEMQIATLLYLEFSYPAENTPFLLHMSNLQAARRMALLYASSRRIASACYKSIPLSSSQQTGLAVQDLFQYRPQFGACLKPCDWLEHKGGEMGMPYYLWDVRNKQTREVKDIIRELGEHPKYVAVSHTWGRWRKLDEPWVSLSSVPWKIPQNSKFEVGDLPNILQDLGSNYVWLDLLTIPQEESSPTLLEVQKIEISRQAEIFENADKSIVWFNDVKSWNVVQACLQWLCLNYLKYSEQIEQETSELIDTVLELMFSKANYPTELSTEPTFRTAIPKRPINPWFTSLWTLKEACLRPDMWLCNDKWDVLCVWDCVPVALSEVVALIVSNAHFLTPTVLPVPTGVRELDRLIRETRIIDLYQLCQTSILTMANERHCAHRRAEAIMSAVGATDWFQTSPQELREQDLVFELYPLAFVNEVRKKMGSASFFSSTPLGWQFRTVLRKFCSRAEGYFGQLEELASMLPFGWGAQNLSHDIEFNSHMIEHDAVKSWVIETSGSVRISEAGIVSSSEDAFPEEKMNCLLAVPSAESGWRGLKF